MVAAIITYDDLEYAEGREVIASNSTVVGFRENGREIWYALDLTDEHAALLERYRQAGRKIGAGEQRRHPPIAPDPDNVPRFGRVVLWHAAGVNINAYWKNYRAWAVSRGYQVTTTGGNRSYIVREVEQYEQYLDSLDRAGAQTGAA